MLSGPAVEALRQHRTRQLTERLALGPEWDDHDLVFANTLGRPIEASNLHRSSFKPLLLRAGLPGIRFHDLRHTCASLLFAKNVHPKVVQERLVMPRSASRWTCIAICSQTCTAMPLGRWKRSSARTRYETNGVGGCQIGTLATRSGMRNRRDA